MPGFNGLRCKGSVCDDFDCNNGTCEKNPDGSPYCASCPNGWKGTHCETQICPPNFCKENGVCDHASGVPVCRCSPGWRGKLCDELICKPGICLHGGTCQPVGEKVKCSCASGYYGDRCQYDPCTNKTCNTGSCKLRLPKKTGNMPTSVSSYCQCPVTHTGASCDQLICQSDSCSLNGNCIPLGKTNFRCKCNPGFGGNRCEQDLCKSSPCHNGGACVATVDGYQCNCTEGFAGQNCDVRSLTAKYNQNILPL